MKDDPVDTRWRELSWRKNLTASEREELRRWLATHPKGQSDWEDEAELNRALDRLPDAPVPSNFTARVLQAVEREEVIERRASGQKWWNWRLRWLPRVAVAGVFLCIGLLSYRHIQDAERVKIARNLAGVPDVTVLSNPEVLANFDAIRAMSPAPAADDELLALLK